MAGTKRRPRTRRRPVLLPRIAPETVAAFKAGDAHTLHAVLGWRPWEISPLQVQNIPEPTAEDLRDGLHRIFFSTWHKARAIRDALEAAATRDD